MPVKICYLDTETTGLDPKRCGIIQIAAIMEIDGKEVDTINLQIRPFPEAEINDDALAISGTNRSDLESFPADPDAYHNFVSWLCRHIDRFYKNDKAFFAGYNSPFDVEFVRQFFLRNGDNYFGSWFWSGTIDVMGAALWALRDKRASLPNFKLETVARHVLGDQRVYEMTTNAGLHNAMTDIQITRELHREITK